jgi:hypothetical protein
MPELSRFYGIIIRRLYGDHAPPHFHAIYQGEEIKVNISTLEVMEGDMTRRAQALVLEWAVLHRRNCGRLGNWQAPTKSLPKLRRWSKMGV